MRDYKFRGWSTDFNKWVYGYACFSPSKERAVIIHKQAGNDMQHTDVVPESIGEYISLRDRNKTEIYEGDIVLFSDLLGSDKTGFVKFRDGCFRLSSIINPNNIYDGEIRMWNDGDHDWYSIENLESFEIEIIGNIYQTPKLLNQ